VAAACVTAGADGTLSVAAGQTFNLGSSTVGTAGRTVADGIAYAVATAPAKGATSVTLSVAPAGVGAKDTVLVITLQDTASTAGTHEFATVKSTTGMTVTFTQPLQNTYQGIVELLRVPSYATVTVAMGATLTAPLFNGATGGVLAFTSAGNVVVTGTITADQIGFAGGTATAGPGTASGASALPAATGAGGIVTCGDSFGGGGGGAVVGGATVNCVPEQAGFGGAGVTTGTAYTGGTAATSGTVGDQGAGAVGGVGIGGGGGGAGGDCNATGSANGGNGGNGGTGAVLAQGGMGGGGGGGGGAEACGTGQGAGGGAGGFGQSSVTNSAATMPQLLQFGGGSGFGGGGGGSGAAGNASGNGTAGTGGAAGGTVRTSTGGPSGNATSSSSRGGGAIFIVAPSITVTGLISANGGGGGSGGAGAKGIAGDCGASGAGGGGGGGAGGAGGAILLEVGTVTLGQQLVQALGGSAGSGGTGGLGGVGCVAGSYNGGLGGAGGNGAAGPGGGIAIQGTATGTTVPAYTTVAP
jgi:hypothetical protein